MRVAEEEYTACRDWLASRLRTFVKPGWTERTIDDLAELVSLVLSEDRQSLEDHYDVLAEQLSDILGKDTTPFVNQVLRGLQDHTWDRRAGTLPIAIALETAQPIDLTVDSSTSTSDVYGHYNPASGWKNGVYDIPPEDGPTVRSAASLVRGIRRRVFEPQARQPKIAAHSLRSERIDMIRSRSRSPEPVASTGYQRKRDTGTKNKAYGPVPADVSHGLNRIYQPAKPFTDSGPPFQGLPYEPYDPTKPVPEADRAASGLLSGDGTNRLHSRKQEKENQRRSIVVGSDSRSKDFEPRINPTFDVLYQLHKDFNQFSTDGPLSVSNGTPARLRNGDDRNLPQISIMGSTAATEELELTSHAYTAPINQVKSHGTLYAIPHSQDQVEYGATQQDWTAFGDVGNMLAILTALQSLTMQLAQLNQSAPYGAQHADAEKNRTMLRAALPPRHPGDKYVAFNYRSTEAIDRQARLADAEARLSELNMREKELVEKILEEKERLATLLTSNDREALEARHKDLMEQVTEMERNLGFRQKPEVTSHQIDNRPKDVVVRFADSGSFNRVKLECMNQRYKPHEMESHPSDGYLVAKFGRHWQAMKFMRSIAAQLPKDVSVGWSSAQMVSSESIEEYDDVLKDLEDGVLDMDAEENLDLAEDYEF